jgi:hypothetical protein
MLSIGSRRQVWNGTAYKTSGGLTRKDIFKDKNNRLKSKKASKVAKKNNNLKKWAKENNLIQKKGVFGWQEK